MTFDLHSSGENVNDEIMAYQKKNKEDEEKRRQAAAAAAAAASTDDDADSSADAKTKKSPTKKQLTEFSELKDEIGFGEVAMAPPTITAKPRKAEVKDFRRNDQLLLSSIVRGDNNNNKNKNKNNKNTKNNNNQIKDNNGNVVKKSKSVGLAVKKAAKLKQLSALQKVNLMNERQRVVDKYRKLKAGNLAKL